MRRLDEASPTLRQAIDALAATEAAELLAEAHADARAKARAILTEALTQALLDRSQVQIAQLLHASSPPGDASAHADGAASAPPSADAAERPAAASGVVGAVDPQDELGWYVYCVLRSSASELPGALRGVSGRQDVTVVREGELAAVASHVPLSAFGEQPLHDNLNDAAWLERTARAHQHVLDEVRARTTVVPLRLCTIYRSERSLRQMLADRREALDDTLQRLMGKTEWGLKVYADPAAAERAAQDADAELTRLDTELAHASPGAAYIRRKQLDTTLKDATARLIDGCVEDTHAQLSRLAVEARRNPARRDAMSGHSGRMVLNGAYLVEDSAREDFHACVAALATRYAPCGCALQTTGPWPPYNFVDRGQEAA